MSDRRSWLEIDLNNLEEEWFMFPKRFFIASEDVAFARDELQDAEIELELFKAELKEAEAKIYLDIQKDPSKYLGKSKPTVGAVAAAVLIEPEYREAQQVYFDGKRAVGKGWDKVNHTQAFVNSLDKVKSALENHVKLHGQNYFSTPYVPATTEGASYVAKMKKRKARKGKKKKT